MNSYYIYSMKYIAPLKYLSVLILPILSYFSFQSQGWITFIPAIFVFGFIPFLELFFKPNSKNMDEAAESNIKQQLIFDLLLYIMVPIQLLSMCFFLLSFQAIEADITTIIGRILSMGLLCGVIGINVAHELGHRSKKHEQWMAKTLLLTSLYTHFFIEHNKGHHKNVATQEDPSSARKNEWLYFFWVRSVIFSYISAWKIENERLKKSRKSVISLSNEMIQIQFLHIIFLWTIYYFFGLEIMSFYLASAIIGFLLLETVNYIEHYGLSREFSGNRFERVQPAHSWNSDHPVGRLLLFELSRHSDHHYIASRKYQILRHLDDSPQMPTGYPGMMLLSTIPPIWLWVMNKRIKNNFKIDIK